MKKLALKELDSLFAAIAAQQALYLPQDDAAGQAQFAPWKEGTALSKRLNTARSAKDLFFPQVENLAGFKREGKSIEIFETREDVRPFTVFGVRACDARSFEILDKVFLKEPVDTFYASRREMNRYHARLHEAGRDLLLPELRHRPCQSCGRRVVLDG